MALKLRDAIFHLVPSAQFTLSGNTLAGLTWLDDRPRPTDAAILAVTEEAFDDARAERIAAGALDQPVLSAVIGFLAEALETPEAEIKTKVRQRLGAKVKEKANERRERARTPDPGR